MKILVTGGCGFVGTHLVKKLIELKHSVVVIDDLSKNPDAILFPKSEYCFNSILSSYHVLKYAKGCEAIIHLAAKTSVPESNEFPEIYTDTNIKGTLGMLEAARILKIPKFIFASSAAIYEPSSIYAVTKIAGENYCEAYSRLYGIKTILLRFFNIYGHGGNGVITKFLQNILVGKPLEINGSGRQTRDFIYIDDVVNAIIESLKYQKSGQSDIGYGESHSINKVAKLCIEISGSSCEIVHKPKVKGEIEHSVAAWQFEGDALLGFIADVKLQEGIIKLYEVMKNEYLCRNSST